MNAIQQRRSIRKYKDTPVDRAQIEELILAASLAPSAKNRQPWKISDIHRSGKRTLPAKNAGGIGKRERT